MSETPNECVKIESLLEAYFEDVLPPKQERMVAEHLWQCPRCAAGLDQIRRLSLALESLPPAEPAADLLAAIALRLDALPAPSERRRLWLGWRRVGQAAGVAMAVLAVLYAVVRLTGARLAHDSGQVVPALASSEVLVQHWWSRLVPALHGILVAVADVGRAVAPTVGVYAAVELAMVVGVAMLLQSRRLHVVAASRVGARRS